MAFIDTDGTGDQRLNVSHSVGAGGINENDDTIVVQALLKFIHELQTDKRWASIIPPEPVGFVALGQTIRVIREFQNDIRRNPTRFQIWVAGDGKVSSAPDGVDSPGPKQLFTISALNFRAGLLAAATAPQTGEANHIQAIFKRFPQVAFAVS